MLSNLVQTVVLLAPGVLFAGIVILAFLAGARPKTSAIVGPVADECFRRLGGTPGWLFRQLVVRPCVALRKGWRDWWAKRAAKKDEGI